MNAVPFCPFCGAKFDSPKAVCSECGKQLGGQQRTMLGMSAKDILEQARAARKDPTPVPVTNLEGTPPGGVLLSAGTPAPVAALGPGAGGTPMTGLEKTMMGAPGAPIIEAVRRAVDAMAPTSAALPVSDTAPASVARVGAPAREPAPASAAAASPAPAPAPVLASSGRTDLEDLDMIRSTKSSAAKWIAIALLIAGVLGGGALAVYTLAFAEEPFVISHEVERKIAGAGDGHSASAFVVTLSVDGAQRPFKVKLGEDVVDVDDGEATLEVPWSRLEVGVNKLDVKVHGASDSLDYPIELVRPFALEPNLDGVAESGKVKVKVHAAKGFKVKVEGNEVSLDKKKGTGSIDIDVGSALDGATGGEVEHEIAYVVKGAGKADTYEGKLAVKFPLPDVPVEVVAPKDGVRIPHDKDGVYVVVVKAPASAEVTVNGKKAKRDPKGDAFEAELKLGAGDNPIEVTAKAPRYKTTTVKLIASYEG